MTDGIRMLPPAQARKIHYVFTSCLTRIQSVERAADLHAAMTSAILSGLCCPTVPYVVTMVTLAIIYFVIKPDRPVD